jgi:thiamine biosynthesis protein ThiS
MAYDDTLEWREKDSPDGITVLGLLEFLKVQQERVAVELNLEIIKKDKFGTTAIKEDDKLEVVSFMQGGF